MSPDPVRFASETLELQFADDAFFHDRVLPRIWQLVPNPASAGLVVASGVGTEVRNLEQAGYTNLTQTDIDPKKLRLATHRAQTVEPHAGKPSPVFAGGFYVGRHWTA